MSWSRFGVWKLEGRKGALGKCLRMCANFSNAYALFCLADFDCKSFI
jgi:hypothetical protein